MTENNKDFQHKSVLADELIKLINLKPGDLAIDCTTGGGGHSSQMLEKFLPLENFWLLTKTKKLSHTLARSLQH